MLVSPELVACPECEEMAGHKGTCRFSEMQNGPGRSVGIWAVPVEWAVSRRDLVAELTTPPYLVVRKDQWPELSAALETGADHPLLLEGVPIVVRDGRES